MWNINKKRQPLYYLNATITTCVLLKGIRASFSVANPMSTKYVSCRLRRNSNTGVGVYMGGWVWVWVSARIVQPALSTDGSVAEGGVDVT